MRRILKIASLFIAALLILALVIPLLFKGRIVEELNKAVNKNIYGKIEFADASVSLFKNFPKLTLTVDHINCHSFVHQDTSQLFQASEIQLGINLWTLITEKDQITINKLIFVNPVLNIIEYDSLNANYQIVPPSDTSSASQQLKLNIEDYKIIGGQIQYESALNGTMLNVNKLSHAGSLKYSEATVQIKTRTEIPELNLEQNNIGILKNARFTSVLDLDYKKADQLFNIIKGEFNLNELKLECKGLFGQKDESLVMDLNINAPGNEFKDLFSILPNALTKDFNQVKSSGTFQFEADINGTYSAKEKTFPSWDVKGNIENGKLQYPGKSIQIENFQLYLLSQNIGPALDKSLIDIKKFSFVLNNQAFNGSLVLSNLIDDLKVAGKVQGVLNLTDLNNFYPLEQNTSISGIVRPDINFKFSESAIKQKQYDQVECSGSLAISNLKYQSGKKPGIAIPDADVLISPKQLEIKKFDLRFGVSDMKIAGIINDPLNFISKDLKVKGKLISRSNLINAQEWIVPENSKSKVIVLDKGVPDFISNLDVELNCEVGQLIYSDYDIRDIKASGFIQGNTIRILDYSSLVNQNSITGTGSLSGIYSYLMYDQTLNGNLNITSKSFDADRFLAKKENAKNGTNSNDQAFVVPSNFNIAVVFKAEEVLYNPMKMNAVKGKLSIVKNEIQFEDLSANLAGGKIALKGLYNTENASLPYFNFKFDLMNLPFSGALSSFVTLRKLAPVMQYIQGYFNTNLIVEGICGQDMMPILDSIKVDGLFETIQGSLKGFKPLELLADKLKINGLKSMSFKNTKNWVSVEDGVVAIKDFNKKIDEFDVNINGSHKLSGMMDYQFIVKIPKNKVSDFTSMIKLDHAMDQLNSILNKTGFGGMVPSNLNILVNMKGTFSNPSYTFKLLNDKGDVTSGESVTESIKSKVTDSLKSRLESEKEKATKEINKIQDSLTKEATKKAEELKNQILDKAKTEATKAIDSSLISKTKDVTKEQLDTLTQKVLNKDAKKEVDQIKDKIKDWNPFKKDKK